MSLKLIRQKEHLITKDYVIKGHSNFCSSGASDDSCLDVSLIVTCVSWHDLGLLINYSGSCLTMYLCSVGEIDKIYSSK